MNAITDEAVEAARLAYSEACKDGWHLDAAARFRAALEAALPYLSDEAVEVVAGHFYTMQSKIAWSQIDPHSSVALNYKRWATEALLATGVFRDPQA